MEFCLDYSTEFHLDCLPKFCLDALMDRSTEFHDNQLEARNIFANKGLVCWVLRCSCREFKWTGWVLDCDWFNNKLECGRSLFINGESIDYNSLLSVLWQKVIRKLCILFLFAECHSLWFVILAGTHKLSGSTVSNSFLFFYRGRSPRVEWKHCFQPALIFIVAEAHELSGSTVSNSLWFFIVAGAHELSGSTVSNSLCFFS